MPKASWHFSLRLCKVWNRFKTRLIEMRQTNSVTGRLGSLGDVSEVEEKEQVVKQTSRIRFSTTDDGEAPPKIPAVLERRQSIAVRRRQSWTTDKNVDSRTASATIPSIQQPRGSLSSMSRAVSLMSRRASLPPVGTFSPRAAGKPTFASLGHRVSSLVRARLAFQASRSKPFSLVSNESDVSATNEVILELPRHPRFSAFMSPEAQYSMMKGYEDKLYESLSGCYPECTASLKRNKTPHHKISIRGKSASKNGRTNTEYIFPGEDIHNGLGTTHVDRATTDAILTSSTATVRPAVVSTHFKSALSSPTEPFQSHAKTSLRSSRELNPAGEQDKPIVRALKHRTLSPAVSTPLNRSHSQPPCGSLPYDRRLILSYRLESAMDILDTIRRRKGEHSLSPRMVRHPRNVAPIQDFISWANVWSKEFKSVQTKI